ncbi:AAA family ATPase [Erythrobacter sp. W302b]|uniref:AAA family ATPase n=1 Tax=Erythrobacter sp. W302b TaxID=3389874 RepID=UPI00396B4688
MSNYTDEEFDAMLGQRLAGAPAKQVERLRTMDLAALAGVEPLPVRFIVEGLLPACETTLLTAPGGGNKTTLSLMIAAAMAARLDTVLGMAIEPGPAAYIGMEDSEGRLHWTLHHICAGLGVSMLDLAGRLHVVSMRQVLHNGLAHFDHAGEVEPTDLYHQAAALIEETGAKLLVLDNLAHLFLGNENDRMQATRFLSLLNKLASDTDAAILLLAHTPIPPASKEQRDAVALLAEAAQKAAESRYKLQQEITRRIPDLAASPASAKLSISLKEWWTLPDFAAFQREVKKALKAEMPLKQRSEWEDWITTTRAEINALSAKISRLETEINAKVYALFNLTPAEIKLLEENI